MPVLNALAGWSVRWGAGPAPVRVNGPQCPRASRPLAGRPLHAGEEWHQRPSRSPFLAHTGERGQFRNGAPHLGAVPNGTLGVLDVGLAMATRYWSGFKLAGDRSVVSGRLRRRSRPSYPVALTPESPAGLCSNTPEHGDSRQPSTFTGPRRARRYFR